MLGKGNGLTCMDRLCGSVAGLKFRPDGYVRYGLGFGVWLFCIWDMIRIQVVGKMGIG